MGCSINDEQVRQAETKSSERKNARKVVDEQLDLCQASGELAAHAEKLLEDLSDGSDLV